jgi:hypothetical protein
MNEHDVSAHYAVFAAPEVARDWSRESWSVHGEMADTVNQGLLRRSWDER